MSDIKSQLKQELAYVEWRDLIPHAQRDVLIVVEPSLDILEVGDAIAGDQVNIVQSWISQNLIHKPTPDQLSDWNITPERQFSTLIVQPFVLVQFINSSELQ
ncbi:DUF2288 domain-containing protein [Aphanothece hegewaldii CCALA 016]|uniref:DUF2288 domain-containing protein n=1 Tax=Aphanothece hegewaldii CCALA 016 TaxID=2107694 RepID=A0A2T1LZ69_9CHRO|nr:DUF2288 family protein [Aphanothece hegewaldii]PSF37661.1 DUF2288 domain-containing protein [Aphanothece hegewaldii CCALA 016]